MSEKPRRISSLFRIISRRPKSIAWIPILVLPAIAQGPDLTYHSRPGGYLEGKRTLGSTFARIDLVAANIDNSESCTAQAGTFRAEFYHPSGVATDQIDLIIRERELNHYYFLEKSPDSSWRPHQTISFAWPTAEVIRFLRDPPVTLGSLGALARIKGDDKEKVRVLPVALYCAHPPKDPSGYTFIFTPDSRVRATFELRADSGGALLGTQTYPTLDGTKPKAIQWPASVFPKDGWYRISITGYSIDSNDRRNQEVRFYHAGQLAN